MSTLDRFRAWLASSMVPSAWQRRRMSGDVEKLKSDLANCHAELIMAEKAVLYGINEFGGGSGLRSLQYEKLNEARSKMLAVRTALTNAKTEYKRIFGSDP